MELGNRFIPSSSSSSAYRNNDGTNNVSTPPLQNETADLSFRDDSFYSLNNSGDNILSTPSPSNNIPKLNNLSPTDSLQESIADALGFDSRGKVFQFDSPTPSNKRSKSPLRKLSKSNSSISIAGPLLSSASSQDLIQALATSPDIKRTNKSKSPKTIVATDILQAPGLRNDFYSNLISWSSKTNKVAVGLGTTTYLWATDNEVEQIQLDSQSLITAVSCSKDDLIVIANARGYLYIIKQPENIVVTTHNVQGKCIFCIEWFSSGLRFLAGNELGEVHIFEIQRHFLGTEIIERNCFKCHQQQICGLALNNDNSQLAVGANDNCCSIWDINCNLSTQLKYVLPHNAAVKAIAFCPWTNSLLATGGGSKDRKIRFWHTKSGTKLNEVATHGQITSLIWSKYRKEIAATFGFGSDNKSSLLYIYSYPLMKPIVEVPSIPNLRILSSSCSPDFCSICVAANDSTVRIYKLWEKSHEVATTIQLKGSGTFGSSLIDYQEGVGSLNDLLR
ncbi:WD40-repeat-containing domain protein [Scheffersomyces amazonensis]|uniref:WD40-repeat-containing domain protein n=1 Tax=Scheffersomyces amazonensis TaxID=1078765 RepID=UPI00315D0A62